MLYRVGALWLAGSISVWAAAAPLKIIRAAVHQIEDGPAVGDRVSFVPGETVYLGFEVQNYAQTKERGVYLTWEVAAADPHGVAIVPPMTGKTVAMLQEEDKNWVPRVRQAIVLPSPAPGGSYSIHVQVTDENSKDSAVADVKFSVSGPDLQPGKTLEVRGFGFYRSEEDTRPMAQAAYRTGESMFARFRIEGYGYGEKNAIEVTYGISILGPAGNVMYTQDPAVEEKSASFYPRPYIDATMSLMLNPGTRAGEYTLLITVRDQVGKQTAELRKPFRVE